MSSEVTIAALMADASQGSSGIGPVVMVVGLTIASALVLSWVIRRLPGSNTENTGASPFARWRRPRDPFGQPPQDPMDQPPKGPFGR